MYFFKRIFLLALLLLAGASVARAEELLKPSPGYSAFTFEPFWAHYSYDEYYPTSQNHYINIKGETGGFAFRWQYFFNHSNAILIPFDAEIYGGTNIRYTGSSGGAGPNYGDLVLRDEQLLLFTIRSLAGYSFDITPNHAINLLAGLAYHFTYNPRTFIYGYDRINHQFYLPLALEYKYQTDIFAVTTHAEYDIFLVGAQYSYFQYQTVPGAVACGAGCKFQSVDTDVPIDKQTKGWGMQLFTEFNIYNFLITPFFNYFWVAAATSTANPTLAPAPARGDGEPENTTITTGIKFGYRF